MRRCEDHLIKTRAGGVCLCSFCGREKGYRVNEKGDVEPNRPVR